MTKLSDIYDPDGRARRMQTRGERATELFRELALNEGEGSEECCTGINIDKVTNGYQVMVNYRETGRGYDYPKHSSKRMVFTSAKGLLAFVKGKMDLSKSEAADLVAVVDGGEGVELNEVSKSEFKKSYRNARKEMLPGDWNTKSGHAARKALASRQRAARASWKNTGVGIHGKPLDPERRGAVAALKLAKKYKKKESVMQFLVVANLSEAGRSKDSDWKVRRRHQISRYGKMIKKHIVPGSDKKGHTPDRGASEKAQKRAVRVRGFVHRSAAKWNKDGTKKGAGGRIRHEPEYMNKLVHGYGQREVGRGGYFGKKKK